MLKKRIGLGLMALIILSVGYIGCTDDEAGEVEELAKHTVTGTVFKAGTTEGIEGIAITVEPSDIRSTTTNQNGSYSLDGLVQGQTYTIKANAGQQNPDYTENEFIIREINASQENADITIMSTRGDLVGIVTNALNNEPLSGVRVTISPGSESRNTGSDGMYTFDELSEREYTLQFTREGFESDNKVITVVAGQVLNGDIGLSPIAPIQVSPSQLDFGSSLSNQLIRITNETSETLDYEIQAPDSWITPTKDKGVISGLNSELIGLRVNRRNMSVGSHAGQVVVNVPGRGSRTVEVLVEKLDASAAVLKLISEGTLNFGSTISERTIGIKNEGDNTLNWSLDTTEDWLRANKTDGSLPPGNSEDIKVIVDRTDLSDGVYNGTINFTSNGGDGSLFAIMEVRSDTGGGGDVVVTSGLRAYFTFDDGEVKDEQGNFQGVPIGASISTDSPVDGGLSMSFDGSGYLQLSGNPIRNTNEETIHGAVSFWVKTSNGGVVYAIPYANNNSYNEFLIALKSNRITHSLDNTSDGRWCCTKEGRSDQNMQALLLNDKWHMVTLSYDGATDFVYVYIDGVRIDQDSYEIAFGAGINSDISRIGADYYSGSDEEIGASNFTGLMDNIRFYSRPLSDSEVLEIFNARQ